MYRSAYKILLTEEQCGRYEVLIALTMKTVSWDVALCCLVENYRLQSIYFLCLYDKLYKGKGKVFPLEAQLWPRGRVDVQLYSSMTTALEVGEWSAAHPSCTLPLGKTQYPLYRRLGGPQGQYGQVENLYDKLHGTSYHKAVVFIVTAMGPHFTQQFLSFTYQNA